MAAWKPRRKRCPKAPIKPPACTRITPRGVRCERPAGHGGACGIDVGYYRG